MDVELPQAEDEPIAVDEVLPNASPATTIPNLNFLQAVRGQASEGDAWEFEENMLLGRNIGYKSLCSRLQTSWEPKGAYRVIDLANNFYIVRFERSEDQMFAQLNGPWQIIGHALSIQLWTPSFRESERKIARAIVWVQFPDLDPSLYHPRVLFALGRLVGNPIKINIKTQNIKQGQYARVAIDVDLNQLLKDTGVPQLESPVCCTFSGPNGPRARLRRNCWANLCHLSSTVRGPWLVRGDFNAILDSSEAQRPDLALRQGCRNFQTCLEESNLMDLCSVGPPFIWRRGLSWVRLDRALGNQD
ncbi:hypothetical protein Tsubulata_000839 [Turnera subulata]|uniref:DUF4283 domain-containing protein n=1 Tax=Turnera subulata TaxID=218843 RepID=A0A9Q0GAI1_9ROSI|nr:hypothetical protein Tsubulata_000839 [Turnera subulata]